MVNDKWKWIGKGIATIGVWTACGVVGLGGDALVTVAVAILSWMSTAVIWGSK